MGRFGGVKDAKWNPGGVYIEPGVHLVRVDAVKCDDNRKGVEFFVVECTILETDHPKVKRGSSASWMNMKNWDTYYGNIKHFVSVAQQIDMDDVDDAGIEMVVSEDNPCRGTILCVKGMNVKTKKDGDFTKCVWSWPEAEDFERIGYNPDGTPKKSAETKTA